MLVEVHYISANNDHAVGDHMMLKKKVFLNTAASQAL